MDNISLPFRNSEVGCRKSGGFKSCIFSHNEKCYWYAILYLPRILFCGDFFCLFQSPQWSPAYDRWINRNQKNKPGGIVEAFLNPHPVAFALFVNCIYVIFSLCTAVGIFSFFDWSADVKEFMPGLFQGKPNLTWFKVATQHQFGKNCDRMWFRSCVMWIGCCNLKRNSFRRSNQSDKRNSIIQSSPIQ